MLRGAQDFHSPKMRTKQHWNSFTTAFFRPLAAVRQELQAHGRAAVDRAAAEALLKQDLRCHMCRAVHSNMPALKRHIVQCAAGKEL